MKNALKMFTKTLKWASMAVGVYAAVAFAPMLRAVFTAEKLDDGLYFIEYRGNDGLDRLIKNGGARSSQEMLPYIYRFMSKGFSKAPKSVAPAPNGYGCSAICARTEDGRVMMGRNFDFDSATGVILHERPRHGYESISTFNVEFYGFGEGWLPEGFRNKYLSLTGVFFALDGINEKGLAVADLMAGDNAETHQNTGKPAFTTTSALRYLLNRAGNVDEAIRLLRSIDMHSDIGSAHHYAISDASGRSVAVEYVDDEMVVIETPVVANHYLCEAKKNVGLLEWDHRFNELRGKYEQCDGIMTAESLTEAIQSASQPMHEGEFLGTAWTMVMDLTQASVTYWSRRHFDNPVHFKLSGKN